MQPFTTLNGVAAPMLRANIDTDSIIRIERMTGTPPEQMGAWAFEALRSRADGSEDPDFVLNRPAFRGAPILLAGDNFGCGSSREGAVWALWHSGVRCVIAPSFGDIFRNNCFQNGLLPVVLPASQIERLAAECGGGAPLSVDLVHQVVVSPLGQEIAFPMEPIRREAMLRGLDEIGSTLTQMEAIATWQARDRAARPWIWLPQAQGAACG